MLKIDMHDKIPRMQLKGKTNEFVSISEKNHLWNRSSVLKFKNRVKTVYFLISQVIWWPKRYLKNPGYRLKDPHDMGQLTGMHLTWEKWQVTSTNLCTKYKHKWTHKYKWLFWSSVANPEWNFHKWSLHTAKSGPPYSGASVIPK